MTCIENPEFIRKIEIDNNCSFADLHHCIQKSCDYTTDQLASFFVAGKNQGRQTEVTLLNMGLEGIQTYIMEKTKLKELITDKDQRLLYVFDFFNDRSFYIELTQISMKKNLQEPKITYHRGDAPAQVLEQELQDQELKKFNNNVILQDYGDVDDYTEIFGEMEDLIEGD